MYRAALAALGTMMMLGCADPMSQFDRIGDVEGGQTQLGFIGDLSRGNANPVTASDVVPYGQLARNCTVTTRDMGTRVAGVSGYDVYDTAPQKAGSRTHFITGFRDGCARQFSGALVLFGDVGTHELIRYADVGIDQPYTATDEAYEVIKASFCRADRAEPCGRRIDRLSKTTSFVTIYESYADNSSWVDILVHKGEVVAKDVNR